MINNVVSGLVSLLKVLTPIILIGGLIIYIIKCWTDAKNEQ